MSDQQQIDELIAANRGAVTALAGRVKAVHDDLQAQIDALKTQTDGPDDTVAGINVAGLEASLADLKAMTDAIEAAPADDPAAVTPDTPGADSGAPDLPTPDHEVDEDSAELPDAAPDAPDPVTGIVPDAEPAPEAPVDPEQPA